MSDSIEPSYYEIALTNRQVVVAFVILLTLILSIFLCGVWVGKNGQERLAQEGYGPTPVTPADAEEPDELANLEELKFFNGEDGAGRDADRGGATTLAEAVGSDRPEAPKPAPRQATPPPVETPEPRPGRAGTSPPPTSAASSTAAPSVATPSAATPSVATPPRPAPRPAATAPATTAPAEGFVVQVFSTRDEPQARKVLSQLKQAGHKAFLSAVEVTGQTMYRVRVGPFAERPAAEQVAGEVRRQMKLDPWVTAAGN